MRENFLIVFRWDTMDYFTSKGYYGFFYCEKSNKIGFIVCFILRQIKYTNEFFLIFMHGNVYLIEFLNLNLF